MGIKCQLESNINIIHNNNNTNRKQTKCSTNISNRICSDKSHLYKVSQAWIRIELNLFYSFQMKETEEEAERERERSHTIHSAFARTRSITRCDLRTRLPPSGFIHSKLQREPHELAPIICFCTFLQLSGSRYSWMCLCPSVIQRENSLLQASISIHASFHWLILDNWMCLLVMCLQLKLLSLHTANESFKGINNDTSSPSKCVF